MAHFAKIGLNSKVVTVHAVNNSDLLNGSGVEDEEVGRQFLERIHHYPFWKQTSYNTRRGKHRSGDNSKALRGNYAGIGMTYDEDNDIFIEKQPYASWTLNVAEARWVCPAGDRPKDAALNEYYEWNESTKTWDKKTY